MRNPRSLSHAELARIVQAIQHALYGLDLDEQGLDALYSCHSQRCELAEIEEIIRSADLHPRSESEKMDALDSADLLGNQLHQAIDGEMQLLREVVLSRSGSAGLTARDGEGRLLICGAPIEDPGPTFRDLVGDERGQQMLAQIRAHSGRQRVAILAHDSETLGIASMHESAPDIVRVTMAGGGLLLFEAEELPTSLELREVIEADGP